MSSDEFNVARRTVGFIFVFNLKACSQASSLPEEFMPCALELVCPFKTF
jgi:hypothetical protein